MTLDDMMAEAGPALATIPVRVSRNADGTSLLTRWRMREALGALVLSPAEWEGVFARRATGGDRGLSEERSRAAAEVHALVAKGGTRR